MKDKIIAAIAAYLEKNCNGYGEFIHFKDYAECWDVHVATEIAAAIAPLVEAGETRFYNQNEYPTRVDGEDFSVDVFILDENGVHGIAFWNFDDEVWRFHTDTLVDYNEPNAETKWKWYYPPFDKETILA